MPEHDESAIAATSVEPEAKVSREAEPLHFHK
jgi:hypothetical protein